MQDLPTGDDYRPNPKVIGHLQNVAFVAIIGPSGVGKTTLINAVIAQDPTVHLVIGDTSRPPRPGERDGIDFYFKRQDAMEVNILAGNYVQVAPQLFEALYATAPESYAETGVATMAVLAEVIPLFRALPFKSMRSIFVVPPSYEIWQQRISSSRNFSPEQFARRLGEAERSLRFALDDQQTHIIMNDDLARATTEMRAVMRDQDLNVAQTTDQAQARQLVQLLLDNIEHQLP